MAQPVTITEKKKEEKTEGIWAENAKAKQLRLSFGCADRNSGWG